MRKNKEFSTLLLAIATFILTTVTQDAMLSCRHWELPVEQCPTERKQHVLNHCGINQ